MCVGKESLFLSLTHTYTRSQEICLIWLTVHSGHWVPEDCVSCKTSCASESSMLIIITPIAGEIVIITS